MWLRIFKHLLPNAKAWRITTNKNLRRFFEGLTGLGEDAKSYLDDVFDDLDPQKTRALSEFEEQFALPSTILTVQQRRDRLDATWKALGGQDPRYIQDTLQAAGFDVYVHEWYEPVQTGGTPVTLPFPLWSSTVPYGTDEEVIFSPYYKPKTFVSRASVATYWDATGTLKTAAIDEERISYDPSDLSKWPQQLLEGEAKNLILHSDDLTVSPWGGSATYNGSEVVRGVTLYEYDDVTATGNQQRQQVITFNAGVDVTVTFKVKKSTAAKSSSTIQGAAFVGALSVTIDWSTNAATFGGGATGTFEHIGEGMYEASVTIPASMVNGGIGIVYLWPATFSGSGATTGSCKFGCVDVVEQSEKSSHIVTTAAQVTRAADIFTNVEQFGDTHWVVRSLQSSNLDNKPTGLDSDVWWKKLYATNLWTHPTGGSVNGDVYPVARNPLTYLNDGTGGIPYLMVDGALDAQDGDEIAMDGSTNSPQGYPLVNKLLESSDEVIGDGSAIMQDGALQAQDGGIITIYGKKQYIIPADPTKYPYFLYIGGEVFPNTATVSNSRRDEFEDLCLKICPNEQWLGILVTYS